jgi:hypothetical protein
MPLSAFGTSFGTSKQHHDALGIWSSFRFHCVKRRGGDIYDMIYGDTFLVMKACVAFQHSWPIGPGKSSDMCDGSHSCVGLGACHPESPKVVPG